MKLLRIFVFSICSFSLTFFFLWYIESGKTDFDRGMGGGNTVLPPQLPDSQEETQNPLQLYYRAYSVKQGDMVGTIASDYGVSQDAIISLNKLRNTRTLQIGQILKIPSIDGIPYTVKTGDTPETIADKYKISLEKLAQVNALTDNTIEPASVIFLPDAKLDWATLQEINGDLFRKPIHGSYYITSRYGWRDNPFLNGARSFHNGIDLAAPRGTPVYAALNGKVISTGYSTVYGNYVIIRHHSGYQTLYGHLHTILAAKGSWVSISSKIGTVGNTGMSTGPHLHFTVYKNGATLNPAGLWN
ncbi:MAG: M23 family metallopeptidase [Treponema sp.]